MGSLSAYLSIRRVDMRGYQIRKSPRDSLCHRRLCGAFRGARRRRDRRQRDRRVRRSAARCDHYANQPAGHGRRNQQTLSDERGAYQFLRLQAGTYIVKGELQGFRPFELRDILVNANATARADVRLEIGTMAEGVTVTVTRRSSTRRARSSRRSSPARNSRRCRTASTSGL